MTKALFIEPDPFHGLAADVGAYIPHHERKQDKRTVANKKYFKSQTENAALTELQAVSRPLNGVSVKPNTPAFVQVVKADGEVVKIFNALGAGRHTAGSGDYSYSGADDLNISRASADGKSHAEKFAAAQQKRNKELEAQIKTRFGWSPAKSLSKGASGTATGDWQTGVDEKGNPTSSYWTDWLLQTVREQRAEKTQVVETFGDTYVYAMGEKPRALIFQGLLMNTTDYNWRATFWENWDKYFRATKLIEMKARVFIGWDDIIVEGYPINAMCTEQADSPNAMSFSFTFFVTNYHNMTARSGWSTTALAKSKISMMRTGQNSGRDGAQATQQIYDNRWSIFDRLGGVGASRGIGNLFSIQQDVKTRTQYDKDDPNKRVYLSEWDKLGLKMSQQAMRVITSIPNKLTNFQPGHLTSWLTGEVSQLTFNALYHTQRATLLEWEREGNFKDGEFNAWFGQLAVIVDNIATSKGMGSWDGNLEDGGGAAFDMFLRQGSIHRLIQRMGYQVNGLLGDWIGAGVYRQGPDNRFGKELLNKNDPFSNQLFQYAGKQSGHVNAGNFDGYAVSNEEGGFNSNYNYHTESYAALYAGDILEGLGSFSAEGLNKSLGYSNTSAPGASLLWGAHNYNLNPDAGVLIISNERETQAGLMIDEDYED